MKNYVGVLRDTISFDQAIEALVNNNFEVIKTYEAVRMIHFKGDNNIIILEAYFEAIEQEQSFYSAEKLN